MKRDRPQEQPKDGVFPTILEDGVGKSRLTKTLTLGRELRPTIVVDSTEPTPVHLFASLNKPGGEPWTRDYIERKTTASLEIRPSRVEDDSASEKWPRVWRKVQRAPAPRPLGARLRVSMA